MENKEELKYKMTGKDAFLALGSCILAKNRHYCDNDIQLLCDKTNEIITPQRAAGLVIEELELGEKNKKVIEIIKEKCVDVWALKISNHIDSYNNYVKKGVIDRRLTQEEYEFLKKALENDKEN